MKNLLPLTLLSGCAATGGTQGLQEALLRIANDPNAYYQYEQPIDYYTKACVYFTVVGEGPYVKTMRNGSLCPPTY